ncbi:hypothetical protein AOZ06_44985 [Kibdelosporangium phytohabitans]|uniref:Uncharacterized protein n=1 Tax=Kibdelosporangium phytohabitans TaxID=860235 RepID=A0A0N9I9M0_9PSEU|nr:hypothetical protein AOZ06_44985 [Kibdelosporangium phytohabitans]
MGLGGGACELLDVVALLDGAGAVELVAALDEVVGLVVPEPGGAPGAANAAASADPGKSVCLAFLPAPS